MSYPTISWMLKTHGVKARRTGRPFSHVKADLPDDALISKLYLSNLSVRDVAERLNISPMAVMTSLVRTKTETRKRRKS